MQKRIQWPTSHIAALALGTLVAFASAGCDRTEPARHNSYDALPLTGIEPAQKDFTAIESSMLSAYLNQTSILKKFDVTAFILPRPVTSGIARLADGISGCIAKKLDELPVSVTSDTIRVEYNLDLTSLCDEAPKEEENVPEVANTASGVIQVSCAGGEFTSIADRKLGQVERGVCANSELIFYSYDQSYAARRVVRTSENGEEALRIERAQARYTLSQPDGSPCFIKKVKDDYEFSPCRVSRESTSFNGTTADDLLPATDPKGQSVFISYFEFGNMRYESGADYFNNSTVHFWINGWRGNVAYTNGWAPPRWEATKQEETVSGIMGSL